MDKVVVILAQLLFEKEKLIKEKDKTINTLLERYTSLKNDLRKNFVSVKALKCCPTMEEVYSLIECVEMEE